jgi:parvulin-like peptidyl-prolyl isomerase
VRSIGIRRLALTVVSLSLLLSGLLFTGCQSDLPQGDIAQVGTAYVTQSTIDALAAAYVAAGKAPNKSAQPDEYRRFEQGLAEYLVTLEVLRQEAAGFNVTVSDSDVQAELATVKQMFMGDDAKFEAALKQQNLTLEQFTQSLKDSLWLDKMKAAVTSDVTVTDAEAQAYYDQHKAEYVEQESRDVRHILISPFAKLMDNSIATTATQAEWDAAKSEADRVRSEILNGADFGTEAGKYSNDVGTADNGGELGAIVRGQMVPAFEDAVFSLQKGELSEPVKTQYGYHLIEVTDITPEQQLGFDQVKENIKSALFAKKQTEAWDAWLAARKAELGVVYRKGYAPASATQTPGATVKSTTTTAKPTTAKPTTTSGEPTTTTATEG